MPARTAASPGRPRLRRAAAALTLTLALAACAAEETGAPVSPTDPTEPTDAPTPTTPAEPAEPTPTEVETLPVEPDEGTGEPAADQTIRGTLGGDPGLEGGCAWIDAEDGTRYEVQYPPGYEVRFEPLELVGPDGAPVAGEGDTLTLMGSVGEDLMSFCQIGPIFVATVVETS